MFSIFRYFYLNENILLLFSSLTNNFLLYQILIFFSNYFLFLQLFPISRIACSFPHFFPLALFLPISAITFCWTKHFIFSNCFIFFIHPFFLFLQLFLIFLIFPIISYFPRFSNYFLFSSFLQLFPIFLVFPIIVSYFPVFFIIVSYLPIFPIISYFLHYFLFAQFFQILSYALLNPVFLFHHHR